MLNDAIEIALAKEVKADATKVGFIYTAGESNSVNKKEGYEKLPKIKEKVEPICGDIYEDGIVNSLDMMYFERYL